MGIVCAYAVPHPPLIIPAVGKGTEKGIPATVRAYRRIAGELVAARPDAIVLLSSHAPTYRDGFYISKDGTATASMAGFGAAHEHFEVHYDADLSAQIRLAAEQAGVPACGYDPNGQELDHASFIPLWFVRKALSENAEPTKAAAQTEKAVENAPDNKDLPPIVRIGLSWLPFDTHRAFGQAIASAIEASGKRVAVVASGDLSHRLLVEGPYGFREEGPVFDNLVTDIFERGTLNELFDIDEQLAEGAGECGLRPFMIMAGMLEGLQTEAQLLSYEGPFGVGYAVASFTPAASDLPAASGASAVPDFSAAPDPYVALARASVEHFVRTGSPLPRPDELPEKLLSQQAGVFVSLHAHGNLRGCIGTISACTQCVADEIISNGISAAACDPRFPAVQPEELDDIEYSVDVLGDAEPIASPDALDPVRYGVIVTKGLRRGLLLPNLEGVDTVEQQISIARAKAGIGEREHGVELQRFEVVRHDAGGEARNGR